MEQSILNLFFSFIYNLILFSYLINSHDSAAPQYCAAAYISHPIHGLCMLFILTFSLPHRSEEHTSELQSP